MEIDKDKILIYNNFKIKHSLFFKRLNQYEGFELIIIIMMILSQALFIVCILFNKMYLGATLLVIGLFIGLIYIIVKQRKDILILKFESVSSDKFIEDYI